MTLKIKCCFTLLKNCFFAITLVLLSFNAFSQKSKADSVLTLLKTVATDSGKVRQMWTLADFMHKYNPDSALQLSQEALYLARKIKDPEGESRSLGILANSFSRIGNYTRSLELNIQKLKLEEKRSKPRNLASVLMNIGIVYIYLEEYRKALEYYIRADSVINKFDVTDFKYNIVLNLGDVYDRMNVSDTALIYFNKSFEMAKSKNNDNWKGKSLTGLGHSFRKLSSNENALDKYKNGIVLLKAVNDNETYCEATLGLAMLFQQMKQSNSSLRNYFDSSLQYAKQSLLIAKNEKLLYMELQAAELLVQLYKEKGNIDSAFTYLSHSQNLNDSLNSKTQIRQLQIISSNEQYRQLELAESRKRAKAERSQQLQHLLITIFIPGLFLLTLFLSKVKLRIQAIRLLGVLSLLFLFEYITLLLHPTVVKLTNHTPVLEILIFVGIASLLIPAHHKLEHWLIHRLIRHKAHHTDNDKKKESETTESKKNHLAE